MKNILLIIFALSLLLAGCSSDDKQKTLLINEIQTAYQKIEDKKDFTSLFSAGAPQPPTGLKKMSVAELKIVRDEILKLDAAMEKAYRNMKDTQEISPNQASEAIAPQSGTQAQR